MVGLPLVPFVEWWRLADVGTWLTVSDCWVVIKFANWFQKILVVISILIYITMYLPKHNVYLAFYSLSVR